MELIDQRTKGIMERCKVNAQKAGLSFQDETLEYIVTNRDLLNLSPKNMIPTLYDYWVHDVRILQERGKYELYPNNPYETVINTKPAISFYNDNNPDWLNVMIFYHVLAHIDFFQNNSLFKNTWGDDFAGIALADKRLIAELRAQKGRWVDYVIEFSRGIDNIIGYYNELSELNFPNEISSSKKINFYFDVFLSNIKKISSNEYFKEIDRYNKCKTDFPEMHETIFFSEAEKKYPEFEALYSKEISEKKFERKRRNDLLEYIGENSKFLNEKDNRWMKSIMEIIRRTSLIFEPQIRTKIMNEGWASYWHEKLFHEDDSITGHEVDFARVNAGVMSMPRAGINPYALGWRLLMYIEDLVNRGKLSYEFEKIKNVEERKKYNKNQGNGLDFLFKVRDEYSDFMLINDFVDQDFVDKYNLFVVGMRMNPQKGVWEYYIKSRDAEEYKKMLFDSLYHPPYLTVDESKMKDNELYLNHHFEGKPLVYEYIHNTMLGIEYLWGGPVKLETSEIDEEYLKMSSEVTDPEEDFTPQFNRILYTMKDKGLTKETL